MLASGRIWISLPKTTRSRSCERFWARRSMHSYDSWFQPWSLTQTAGFSPASPKCEISDRSTLRSNQVQVHASCCGVSQVDLLQVVCEDPTFRSLALAIATEKVPSQARHSATRSGPAGSHRLFDGKSKTNPGFETSWIPRRRPGSKKEIEERRLPTHVRSIAGLSQADGNRTRLGCWAVGKCCWCAASPSLRLPLSERAPHRNFSACLAICGVAVSLSPSWRPREGARRALHLQVTLSSRRFVNNIVCVQVRCTTPLRFLQFLMLLSTESSSRRNLDSKANLEVCDLPQSCWSATGNLSTSAVLVDASVC